MDSIVISNVDDDLKHRLAVRAAKHGHSIEVEAGDILRSVLEAGTSGNAPIPSNLADAIRAIVEPLGGVDLEIAQRTSGRAPPRFERVCSVGLRARALTQNLQCSQVLRRLCKATSEMGIATARASRSMPPPKSNIQ